MTEASSKGERGRRWWLRFWRETARPILVVLIVVSSFRSAVADWHDVPTGSMKPTIIEGDRIFVNKLAYDLTVPFTDWRLAEWGDPQRGDVVILFSPADEKRLVKRVVAVPGDLIEMRRNRLYINGRAAIYGALDREFIDAIEPPQRSAYRFASEAVDSRAHPIMLTPAKPALRSVKPTLVPEGQYFVMGDNRDDSLDSRWFGLASRDRIVGRVPGLVLSLDREHHYRPRWGRFFKSIP